jgi:hypothetical protein
MIEVFTVPISKAQFRTLPPRERAMVFVSCHILNQIGVLVKLVRFSSNRDPENHIEENASGTQTQIILRFLIAVLSEACVSFGKRNFAAWRLEAARCGRRPKNASNCCRKTGLCPANAR